MVASARKRDESKLLAEIRLQVGSRKDFLINRINTGVFASPDNPKVRIRSAPDGFPDAIGTQIRRVKVRKVVESNFSRYESDEWHVYGQAIAVETKSLRGPQREAQIAWQAAFERVGGIYILARSVEDVLTVLGAEPELME